MIYPANFEVKIGFDRIREQVAQLCTTATAIGKLGEETFSGSATVIGRRQRLCDEMLYILTMESGFPGGEYADTGGITGKARVEGAYLVVEELIILRTALSQVGELLDFFSGTDEDKYPELKKLSVGIYGFSDILARIDRIIDRYGKVRDNASQELDSIRRAIRDREGQASKKLHQILAQARKDGIVDSDATLSIRGGRGVIPVSAANKRKIRGFVHDESATGKTVYIEPVEIVEINNELKELEYDERREIIRILTDFTDSLRPHTSDIESAGDYLCTIDMIRAKARFASANGCVMPIMSDEGVLELRGARHPLLAQTLKKEGRELVPLDMRLTREKHILVISGPNAGGKSVCLKTVGLLQYMFQCGFPVPVKENSEFPLFDSIFIDIGDEQSIDNDLSTYSSHLLNMKNMLANATDRSLVLIDEFGTGTEPIMGGAIAESILEKLEECRTYGVITTHYANLKYYASNAKGIVNGAMTFDVQNIRPLFRLEMGKPGSSFAIEIARKTGLPEDIIRSAGEKAGNEHVNLEKQLREIARDKRYWEQKRDRIRVADKRVEELETRYEEQLSKIRQERSEIIRTAKEEAKKILADANREIENTIRTIKESQAEKEQTRLVRRRVDELRESLDSAQADADTQEKIEREMERLRQRKQRREERKARKTDAPQTPEPVKLEAEAGSKVRIEGQGTIGEVVSVKGKKATVAFGQILTTVEKDRLTVVSNTEYRKQQKNHIPAARVNVDISERKLNFRQNIDVRGERAADALERVRDFIDDAIMMGASEVRILHGKGTGALKEEIRRYLRSVDEVAGAEDEHVDLGGAGITVVKLK